MLCFLPYENESYCLGNQQAVVVFYCCSKKLPQALWLKTTKNLIVQQVRSQIQVSLSENQHVSKAVFLSGGSKGESAFLASRSYILALASFLQLHCVDSSSVLLTAALFYIVTSCSNSVKAPMMTLVLSGKSPYLRVWFLANLIPSTTLISPCHVLAHKFQRLGHGHLRGGHYSGYNRGLEPNTQLNLAVLKF